MSSSQLTRVAFVVVAVFVVLCINVNFVVVAAPASEAEVEPLRYQCGHTLTRPKGLINSVFDMTFLKKVIKHWVPFTSSSRVKMQFFLFKRDFPDCGRELVPGDDELLEKSGFDARHPTRIIIHGWMSQSKGSLTRDVKAAYLSMTYPSNNTNSAQEDAPAPPLYSDFNIIVCDWSKISSNVNYFGVADLVEDLGFLLAEFVRHLHMRAGLEYNDVYLIGHSLGAQIAGSAGKQIKPYRFNTIYALDPAGPKFREQSDEYRIDASDAEYVESILTSITLGFEQPVGHATFYANYGKSQKKCYMYGCSHKRAHDYFAESLTSAKGFWGTRCERQSEHVWILLDGEQEYRMGGEPSVPKNGTFYVKTNDRKPYAMGRRKRVQAEPEEPTTEKKLLLAELV